MMQRLGRLCCALLLVGRGPRVCHAHAAVKAYFDECGLESPLAIRAALTDGQHEHLEALQQIDSMQERELLQLCEAELGWSGSTAKRFFQRLHPEGASSAPASAPDLVPAAAPPPHRRRRSAASAREVQAVWESLLIPASAWTPATAIGVSRGKAESKGLTAQAIEAAQAGKLDSAVALFVRAVTTSLDGPAFGNLATALTDWSMQVIQSRHVSPEAALPLLQTANAALDIALLLTPYNPHILNELRRIKRVGASMAGQGCTASGCGSRFPLDETSGGGGSLLRRQELAVSRALRVALRRHWETTAEEEDDLGGAGVSKEAQWVDTSLRDLMLAPVSFLCAEKQLLRVHIPRPDGGGGETTAPTDGADKRTQRPVWLDWLAGIRRAVTLHRICGVVVLDSVLPNNLTQTVYSALAPVQKKMTDHAEATRGQRNASWEMLYNPVTPGARRYHGQVPLRAPFTDPALIWAPALREVLTATSSGNRQIEIGRYSFVTAMPGSGDQNWHKDVDEPFKDFGGEFTSLLHAHANSSISCSNAHSCPHDIAAANATAAMSCARCSRGAEYLRMS